MGIASSIRLMIAARNVVCWVVATPGEFQVQPLTWLLVDQTSLPTSEESPSNCRDQLHPAVQVPA